MKKKKGFILQCLVGFVLIFFAIRFVYWKIILHKKGVYVIGLRTYFSPGGENGNDYRYAFIYRGKKYEGSFADAFFHYEFSDSLLFIKVLPQKPDGVCNFLTELKVPKCFMRKDVPYEGWKQIPIDTCK